MFKISSVVHDFLQAKAEMVKINNKLEGAVKIKPGLSKVGKLKKKRKKKTDPKAPKRPASAYLEFVIKERKVWSDTKSVSYQDKLKEMGRKWRSLSEEERAPYVAIASEKKEKFKQVGEKRPVFLFQRGPCK